jgi:hypothetical protein
MTSPITAATGPTNIQGADFAPAALTAEAILAYCTSRLNTLDSMINSRLAEQEGRNKAVTAAGKLIAQLNTMSQLGDPSKLSAGDLENHRLMGVELKKLFNETADPQVQQKICDAYAKTTGTPLNLVNGKADPNNVGVDKAGMHKIEPEVWQGFVGDVKTLQDSLTKGNEIGMIGLQSIVSQRQLAIQLTTQLMAAFNEGNKTVVANIRV